MTKLGTGAGRVLIVGWGFIGAAVGEMLAARGLEVVALTRSERNRNRRARALGVEMLVGDAADPGVVESVMGDVDHILFTAGGLLPSLAAAAPLEDAVATLSPLVTVLEAIRRHPGVGLTYVSSGGTVYGNPVRNPVCESDPAEPVSQYGVSRLAGELYAQMYARTYGMALNIVRCANVYGPGQPHTHTQGAVAAFLDRVAAGLPVTIIGDGSAQRDYVLIHDIAATISQIIADRLTVDVVNLGTGRGHSVMQLLEFVSRVVGRPAMLAFQAHRKHDVDAIVLDITRIRSFLDYQPTDLEVGLELTWQSEQGLAGGYPQSIMSERG